MLALGACGAEEEAEVPEVAAGSAPAEVAVEAPPPPPGMPDPMHGGTVLAAGDYPIEVVAHDDGYVDAFVLEEAPPPGQTQITVRVPADDGEVHPVMLTWDPSASRWRGRLRRVQPVPGPVEVNVVVDGDRYEGRAPRVVVIGPAPAAGAVVEVERPSAPRVDVQVERPAPPSVEVHVERRAPPRAQIVVEHPRGPDVVIHRPGRPGVIVDGPRPRRRVRVRGRHDKGRHLGHRRGRRHRRH